jgi:hypothetical protein
VFRRDDFLVLDFECLNLGLEGTPLRLVRVAPGEPAYLKMPVK